MLAFKYASIANLNISVALVFKLMISNKLFIMRKAKSNLWIIIFNLSKSAAYISISLFIILHYFIMIIVIIIIMYSDILNFFK